MNVPDGASRDGRSVRLVDKRFDAQSAAVARAKQRFYNRSERRFSLTRCSLVTVVQVNVTYQPGGQPLFDKFRNR